MADGNNEGFVGMQWPQIQRFNVQAEVAGKSASSTLIDTAGG